MSLASSMRDESPACAEPGAPDDVMIGRRQSTRHSLQLSGRFVSRDANVRVWIEDISATGAAIRLMHPRALDGGRLSWLGFEHYADIVWQHETRCGLRFADGLPLECLRTTLESGELAATGNERMKRLASAWVHGPGDY